MPILDLDFTASTLSSDNPEVLIASSCSTEGLTKLVTVSD